MLTLMLPYTLAVGIPIVVTKLLRENPLTNFIVENLIRPDISNIHRKSNFFRDVVFPVVGAGLSLAAGALCFNMALQRQGHREMYFSYYVPQVFGLATTACIAHKLLGNYRPPSEQIEAIEQSGIPVISNHARRILKERELETLEEALSMA